MSWLISVLIIGSALSGNARAEVIDFWSLRGNAHGAPLIQELTDAELTDEGILLRTAKKGFILWQNQPITQPTEVITIGVRTEKPVTLELIWIGETVGEQTQTFSAPVRINGSSFRQEIDITLSTYNEWNWQTDGFGFSVPAGTELLLQDIEFRHWTLSEKIIEAWKSFWMYDRMRGYSINFLWGPQLAFNAPARVVMFDSTPPQALYGMFAVYGLIAIAAIAGTVWSVINRDRSRILMCVTLSVCILWVLLDIRMGTEVLSYALTDIRTYVQKEGLDRSLRGHEKAHAVVEEIAHSIEGVPHYALFTPEPSAYFQMLRYRAYPAEPIIHSPDAHTNTYVILGRHDIAVSESGALIMVDPTGNAPGGVLTLASSGKIIYELERGTFIYVTQ